MKSTVLLAFIALAGSASAAATPNWWVPKPTDRWQWQLQGTLNLTLDVDVYDIDMFDTSKSVIDGLHKKGKKVICYVDVGSWENWRPDAKKFPSSVLGGDLSGWAGERWLDIRKLSILQPIMSARFALAKSKGCDAIEPDNVDSYTNTDESHLNVTYADQIKYNTWIANEVHSNGMGVALKNDLDQVKDLVDLFDFAVNEECVHYNECSSLLPFAKKGKAVFGVEYTGSFPKLCTVPNKYGFVWMKKHLDLDSWAQFCTK